MNFSVLRRRWFAPVAAVLWASAAAAQTPADFERLDANRDNFVSLAEFETARQADFAALDGNKDGVLSRGEFVSRGGGGLRGRLRERSARARQRERELERARQQQALS